MKQPLKPQSQTVSLSTFRRCEYRSRRVSWCKKLSKICNAPEEYSQCSSYQPKPINNKAQQIQKDNDEANQPHTLLIGVKTGRCDICKATKKTLLLRFGFSLCEDCLSVCTTILENLQINQNEPPKERHLQPKNKGQRGKHP